MMDGKLNWHYTFFDAGNSSVKGTMRVPSGDVKVTVKFTPDGNAGGSGTLEMMVNGEPAGSGKINRSLFRHGLEPFEIGRDSNTPVDPEAYKSKGDFAFTGTINKVDFKVNI